MQAPAGRTSASRAPSRSALSGLVSVEPTERCVWALVGVAVLGTLGAGLPSLGDAALVAAIGLGLGVLADVVLAGSPRKLEVARVVPDLWTQGVASEMAREIFSSRAVDVVVTDALPAAASEDGRGSEQEVRAKVAAGERVRLPGHLTLYRRGEHRFGRLTVRTHGPLGLVRRRMRHEVETLARVVPDLTRIGARAERLLRGQDADGARRRRAPKEGRELESLREYQRGDDPRLIEWKASARAGELIVRRMQPETRQDVVVLVDTGRHLAGRHERTDGGAPRLDVALEAALTLCAAALSNGDRAGCLAFAGDARGWASPQPGRGHLRRISDEVSGCEVLPEEADYGAAVRFLLARQKRRSLVAFVTDVLDEPSARALSGAVARLRGRHVPVVVAVADPALARLAKEPADAEPAVRLAAERLLAHRRAALAALASAGAVVVDAPAPRAAALAVQAYLGVKASGRL